MFLLSSLHFVHLPYQTGFCLFLKTNCIKSIKTPWLNSEIPTLMVLREPTCYKSATVEGEPVIILLHVKHQGSKGSEVKKTNPWEGIQKRNEPFHCIHFLKPPPEALELKLVKLCG